MNYKFRIISSENDAFIREVAIDSKATFFDLHSFIIEELGYEHVQMTSFFLTDQNWHKETEITLIDMTEDQVPDIKVMEENKIGHLISEKKQRLLYVFDQFAERSLFLELYQIQEGQMDSPKCLRRQGNAPPQFDESALESGDLNAIDMEELLESESQQYDFEHNEGDIDIIDEEDLF
jgi:hypothetical protein